MSGADMNGSELDLGEFFMKYPRTAAALVPLMTVKHSDPADQEAFSKAKDQLMGALASNPEIPENLEKQMKSNPELGTTIVDLAKNDPKALNEMMPTMIGNSDDIAGVITQYRQAQANPPQAEATTQKAEQQEVKAAPEPRPHAEGFPVSVAAATATGAGASVETEAAAPVQGSEPDAKGSSDQTSANPSEPDTAGMGSAESTGKTTPDDKKVSVSDVNVEALKIVAELKEKPGGQEFFDKVAEDPTLATALENAMKGEGGDSAKMLATLKDVQKMVKEDDRLFVKVNNYMDDHPGAMQKFANTFANDPDKAFDDLKMGMMMDKLEGPLANLLGPELAGKIMSWLAPIMELFSGLNEFLGMDVRGQSNAEPVTLDVKSFTFTQDANGKITDQYGNQVKITQVDAPTGGQSMDDPDNKPAEPAAAGMKLN